MRFTWDEYKKLNLPELKLKHGSKESAARWPRNDKGDFIPLVDMTEEQVRKLYNIPQGWTFNKLKEFGVL